MIQLMPGKYYLLDSVDRRIVEGPFLSVEEAEKVRRELSIAEDLVITQCCIGPTIDVGRNMYRMRPVE